jgi:hypothetical protein
MRLWHDRPSHDRAEAPSTDPRRLLGSMDRPLERKTNPASPAITVVCTIHWALRRGAQAAGSSVPYHVCGLCVRCAQPVRRSRRSGVGLPALPRRRGPGDAGRLRRHPRLLCATRRTRRSQPPDHDDARSGSATSIRTASTIRLAHQRLARPHRQSLAIQPQPNVNSGDQLSLSASASLRSLRIAMSRSKYSRAVL